MVRATLDTMGIRILIAALEPGAGDRAAELEGHGPDDRLPHRIGITHCVTGP